jgi:polygalacturonase
MMLRTFFIFCILVIFSNSSKTENYSILTFGAKANDTILNTEAIQKTIDFASEKGGGRVIIPKGTFLSGTIILKSGVELHLQKGAVLLGSTNITHYKKLKRWKALVMAEGEKNIAITGKGMIDGQGGKLAMHIDSLFHAGKLESKYYNFLEDRPKAFIRPQIIEFNHCSWIKVIDITIKNSASWVQTYEACNQVIVNNIKVESMSFWNNDGIDIVDCRNFRLTNSHFNSADDGICLKSADFSRKYYSDSIYIANCTVRSSASAVKFGTNLAGLVQNVVIRDIKVYDTYRSAIAIETMYGGLIDNVLVENIQAKNTGNAIFMRIGNLKNTSQGELRNVTIRNLKVDVPYEQPDYDYDLRGPTVPGFHNVFPSSITGNPGYNIENVTLENIEINYPGRGLAAYAYMPLYRIHEIPELITTYPEFSMFGELPAWGLYVRHVVGLTMKNVKVCIKEDDYRTAMVFDDVKNLSIQDLRVIGDAKKEPLFFKNVPNPKLTSIVTK